MIGFYDYTVILTYISYQLCIVHQRHFSCNAGTL